MSRRPIDHYSLARALGVSASAIIRRHQEIDPHATRRTPLSQEVVDAICSTPKAHLDRLEGFTWRTAPADVTTSQAATLAGVTPATIRQWASRNLIASTGRAGREGTYSRDAVRTVSGEMRTRRQARSVAPDYVPHTHDATEVTLTEAARFFGLSPATLRSWAHRGHLEPTGNTHGSRSLYRIADVRQVAYSLAR